MGVVMHKLLRIRYGIFTNQTPYDPAIDRQNRENTEAIREEMQRKTKQINGKSNPAESLPLFW